MLMLLELINLERDVFHFIYKGSSM